MTSSILGEIRDCGCSVNPRGGLDRIYQYFSSIEGGLKVDAGNALFVSKSLDPGLASEQKKRASSILKVLGASKLQAMNVSLRDLAAGEQFLLQEAEISHVPLVSSNLFRRDGGKMIFPELQKTIFGGKIFWILGLTQVVETNPYWGSYDPEKTIARFLEKIPKQDVVIVLNDLDLDANRVLARRFDRPLLFLGSSSLAGLELPEIHNKSLLIQPLIRGQQVARLDLQIPSGALKMIHSPELNETLRMRGAVLDGTDYVPNSNLGVILFQSHQEDMSEKWAQKNMFSTEIQDFE